MIYDICRPKQKISFGLHMSYMDNDICYLYVIMIYDIEGMVVASESGMHMSYMDK